MPCRGADWVYVPSTSEELRIIQKNKIREESVNLALLIRIVEESLNLPFNIDVEYWQTNPNTNTDIFTFLTQTLCDLLKKYSTFEDHQKILQHPQGIFVGAWWGKHQKLDEKRN